jgi:EAL domain-containing protein (putative c-di-GMP-specific phosphodiesterase class I)
MSDTFTPHRPPSDRPLGERERFVAFAFAAADLLVEADLSGRIIFATGAFRARLNRRPEELIGHPVAGLVAPADRAALAAALAVLPLRGRLEPATLHLADAVQTPFVVSGLHLALPGHVARLCLSFAPMPGRLPDAPTAMPASAAVLQDAEERMRRAATGEPVPDAPDKLGMVEIRGEIPEALMPDIRRVVGDAGGGACLAAEVAPGRFSLLPRAGERLPDTVALAQQLDAMMPANAKGNVRVDALPLSAAGLTPLQAARALRNCLSAFAAGGIRGVADAGFQDGLPGYVADVAQRSQVLRRAVKEGRFSLEYQPIASLADRSMHHYEALLRPERGLLGRNQGPAEFVSLAEMVGLTEELDLAVLEHALRAIPRLGAGERIAINISGLSMQSATFRDELLRRLDVVPEACRRIMVELTETAEIEHEDGAVRTLAALAERGVPACLDDFGAGAAAFRYLKAFKVDYVKVDGAFVEAAVKNPRDRSFVSSMVDLSLAVGAKVIAERIETEEHAATMLGLGVEFGQGWHLGRPGPLPERPAGRTAAKVITRHEDWS